MLPDSWKSFRKNTSENSRSSHDAGRAGNRPACMVAINHDDNFKQIFYNSNN